MPRAVAPDSALLGPFSAARPPAHSPAARLRFLLFLMAVGLCATAVGGWSHARIEAWLLSVGRFHWRPAPRGFLPPDRRLRPLPSARPESHVFRLPSTTQQDDGQAGAPEDLWVFASEAEPNFVAAGADPKKGHHIYSDIDDTLIPACGHAGGMDRRFCKYRIYPGVVQLYKAIAGDYRRLTILSARPGGSLGKRRNQRLTTALGLYFAAREALGSEDRGAAAIKALVNAGLAVDMRFGRKEDCYLYVTGRRQEAFARFGAQKAWNARQYQLDHYWVPQVRKGRAVFFGDNGQGDEAGALQMLEQGLITHAFIQKVNESKPVVVHTDLSYFRTTLLAAAQAYKLGIIDYGDLLGLSDTVKAPMTQYCAGRQGDPTCEEYAALDVRVRRRWRLTRRGVGLAPK
eukprot:EG_transcript_12924